MASILVMLPTARVPDNGCPIVLFGGCSSIYQVRMATYALCIDLSESFWPFPVSIFPISNSYLHDYDFQSLFPINDLVIVINFIRILRYILSSLIYLSISMYFLTILKFFYRAYQRPWV